MSRMSSSPRPTREAGLADALVPIQRQDFIELLGAGRPADDDPAHRPAATRVPSPTWTEFLGQGRAGRGQGRGRPARPQAARWRQQHPRGQPDARPARRAPGAEDPWPVRPRSARSPRRRCTCSAKASSPSPRSWSRSWAPCASCRSSVTGPRRPRRRRLDVRCRTAYPIGCMIEPAASRPHGRPHRGGGGVFPAPTT